MTRQNRLKRLGKDQQVCNEVREIMHMWLVIERSYDRLSDEERNQIETKANPFGRAVRFDGFAGNEETEYYSAALELTRVDFDMFKERELDSHLPRLDAYRQMLRVFEFILTTSPSGDLSISDIVALLRARRPPH